MLEEASEVTKAKREEAESLEGVSVMAPVVQGTWVREGRPTSLQLWKDYACKAVCRSQSVMSE